MKKLLALTVVCAAWVSFAETYTVTSNADSGEGTLRQLVADSSAGDEIIIPSGMTITLSSTITLPNRTLTVRGQDKTATISGGGATIRLFEINNAKIGNKYYPIRIEFANVTIRDAVSTSKAAGFVLTDSTQTDLVVNDCEVRNLIGEAALREGAFVTSGKGTYRLFVTNTLFTACGGGMVACGGGNNWSAGMQGAVFKSCKFTQNTGIGVFHAAPLSGEYFITEDCVFANNTFTNDGAYILFEEANVGTVIMRGCVITNNVFTHTADSIYTTAIRIDQGGGHLIEKCYIADNQGKHNCVGCFGQKLHDVTMSDCVIERNQTTSTVDPNNYSNCGLIYAILTDHPGVLTITNCVFRENTSRDYCLLGGNGGGSMRIVDSLFESNCTFCPFIFNGAKSVEVERCAIVGNRRHPDSTKTSSSAVWNASAGGTFRNVLFFENDINGNRFFLPANCNYENCTIVSNTVPPGWTGISGISTGIKFRNNVLAGLRSNTTGAIQNDLSVTTEPEGFENCYIEKSASTFTPESVKKGYTTADLKLNCVLTTNGSNTVFLDGSRMPALQFSDDSPLKNAASVVPELNGLDLVHGVRKPNKIPDIGCWEFPEVTGLTIIYR